VAKTSKMDIYKRRLEVRNLVLKGFSDSDIIDRLKISQDTLTEDKRMIADQYIRAVTENKNLLTRQAELIMKHLDQLDLIKKKLWEIEEAVDTPTRTKIDALKSILTELEHESKILRLIDNSNIIVKQYIHIDKINVLMNKITEVIKEFVPSDQQRYAFDRLRSLGNVLEAEVVEPEKADNEKDETPPEKVV